MKKLLFTVFILSIFYAFTDGIIPKTHTGTPIQDLSKYRQMYSKPISQWEKPQIDKGVEWEEFSPISFDENYEQTMEQPLILLGKMLFFDPKLSGSNQISCSSCHDPELGWSDGRERSLGHDHLLGKRNTPSLFNTADRKSYFFDGRAATLEEQADGPITTLHEMNAIPSEIVKKLSLIQGYKPLFKNAFGTEEITYDKIRTALAEFQKTIRSTPSRFDKFLNGNYKALTDEEIYGLHLFRTKARCMNCHYGKHFTDEKFHNIGLSFYKRELQDLGRYDITQNPDDIGRFRTPTLRDLMITKPWMHNGLVEDLQGVINMYNSGMLPTNPTKEQKAADPLYPVTDPLMKPLGLTKEESLALQAFIKSLTNTHYKMSRPDFPRAGGN